MKNPGLISLLSDFGSSDWYVGTMKGVILSINPQVRIIDICHEVRPHHIVSGAFMLQASYSYFPEGTIHTVVVDPGVGGERRAIIVETESYYFVGPDNGLLSFVLESEKPQRIVEITRDEYFLKPTSHTFHGRDVFAPVAAHLSAGVPLEKFGKEIENPVRIDVAKPILLGAGKARGHILYLDTFGNAITDVPSSMLSNNFIITIKDKVIDKVCASYSQATQGEIFCIVGSSGSLEISAKEESAAEVLSSRQKVP